MLRGTARFIQRLFFVIGFLVLGYVGANWVNSRIQQTNGNQELDRLLSQKTLSYQTKNGQGLLTKKTIPDGALVGRVEVPKLHLSAVVFQGATNAVLDKGVGHLDGSPLPGQGGNVVLAAHRDTFFRALRDIRKGDDVTVTTPSGPRTYKVDSTEIVDPTETSVLNPTPKPTLTLITCYPFYFVGHAPKRFIVRALDENAGQEQSAAVKNEKAQEVASAKPASLKPTAAEQPAPDLESRVQTPEEIENLTYVFRASQ
ncbi:MAG TPA: class D sortase [Bryobacteraceae bacterium]|jgi:sortase A|nr:class D sortase [Bryobacteraceae bacterium]